MADTKEFTKYDDVLSSILLNEKSLLGFLSAIFNFLARRTDFYYVPEGPYKNMGFPPGVAEELVLKVVRSCDPNKRKPEAKLSDINNDIMCSTIAQEVEVVAEEDMISDNPDKNSLSNTMLSVETGFSPAVMNAKDKQELKPQQEQSFKPEDYTPPKIPEQKNTESYNGAIREKYSWSQTIMDLDVTIKLPPDIKSSKDLKVVINAGDLLVQKRIGEVMLKDAFLHKVKASESLWSISEARLLIHLDKTTERWWNKLLVSEEPIDLSKIDCSRPIDELPEDHIDKIRELQWNQERKHLGLPTTEELRKIDLLKKAWNAEGSPFKGQEFDPSVLKIAK